jgi:hypothetical protein
MCRAVIQLQLNLGGRIAFDQLALPGIGLEGRRRGRVASRRGGLVGEVDDLCEHTLAPPGLKVANGSTVAK